MCHLHRLTASVGGHAIAAPGSDSVTRRQTNSSIRPEVRSAKYPLASSMTLLASLQVALRWPLAIRKLLGLLYFAVRPILLKADY